MAGPAISNFSVVHFLNDDSVEVVPSKWITEDSCKFPDKLTKGLGKLLRNSDKEPCDSWESYKIKLVKSYGR
jgi:hypothetical protein